MAYNVLEEAAIKDMFSDYYMLIYILLNRRRLRKQADLILKGKKCKNLIIQNPDKENLTIAFRLM